jgi:hypothetical protein
MQYKRHQVRSIGAAKNALNNLNQKNYFVPRYIKYFLSESHPSPSGPWRPY